MRVSHFLCCSCRFQSTPPARGGDAVAAAIAALRNISIHAPREGGDRLTRAACPGLWTFQSTPPARGATVRVDPLRITHQDFNPRPPRGGRRGGSRRGGISDPHFNPRPPRGGRLLCVRAAVAVPPISIHAPREGGDHIPPVQGCGENNFNPRPPRGGRLKKGYLEMGEVVISIHAPREGGDSATFNNAYAMLKFQSTPPARGATSQTI